MVEFIDEIRFFASDYPGVSIERNMSMWRLSQEIGRSEGVRLNIKDGKVAIPDSDLDLVKRAWLRNSGDDSGRKKLWAMISVDDYSDAIRLFPFFTNAGIMPFGVAADNKPGAIAAIARLLSQNQFNLLASKAWTSPDQMRSRLWLLLQDRTRDQDHIWDDDLGKKIEDLILSSEDLREYGIQAYPIKLD